MTKSKIRSLSKEQLSQAIESLQIKYPLDSVPKNHNTIYKETVDSLGGLFPEQTTINNEKRRFFFFRIRTANSFNSYEETKDPEQYSYKPKSKCNDIGRAHLPGHPVFYGCDSYETAIREMKQPEIKKYYIALWHTREINLERLNFLCASPIKSQRLIQNFHDIVNDIDEQFAGYDDFNRDRIKAHVRAWSDLFLSSNYTLSASIAHEMLYDRERKFDIICLPTGVIIDSG